MCPNGTELEAAATKTPEIEAFDIINDGKHKEKHAANQFFSSLLELCLSLIEEELAQIWESAGDERFRAARYTEATGILRDLIQSATFVDFLTLPAYDALGKLK